MKKSATWLRSSEPKLLMVARPLSRLPRRSTNTKPEQLNSLARCLQLFLNCPCSSPKCSSCSKRRKRKTNFLRLAFKTSTRACHPHTIPMPSGKRFNVTHRERDRPAKSACSAKLWRPSLPPMESRQTLFPVPTLTCQPTSSCLGPTACLHRSNQASPVRRCGTLRSPR